MANRNTLHKSKLKDFKAWLISDGWTMLTPNGTWEVLRAIKPGKHILIVYTKLNAKEHYTV